MNPDSQHHDGTTLADVAYEAKWGAYAPAIAHHAEVVGRPAPAPTIDDKLSPAFVEWMMMLPAGWVTDVEISHTGQLRCLGNAVVPRQAQAAWGSLLGLGSERDREREREHLRTLPTPRTSDANGPGRHGDGGPDLRTAVTCLLIPTPTAWLGRRPARAIGDPARWDNPERSRELSDFLAWLAP